MGGREGGREDQGKDIRRVSDHDYMGKRQERRDGEGEAEKKEGRDGEGTLADRGESEVERYEF